MKKKLFQSIAKLFCNEVSNATKDKKNGIRKKKRPQANRNIVRRGSRAVNLGMHPDLLFFLSFEKQFKNAFFFCRGGVVILPPLSACALRTIPQTN